MLAQVAVRIDVGTVLTGLGAIVVAVTGFLALNRSRRAEQTANKALEASPAAVYEGLKSEVQSVVDAYVQSVERWTAEREGMEEALSRERARADASNVEVFKLRAELAAMRIDMAASRAEVVDLRSRFETAIGEIH